MRRDVQSGGAGQVARQKDLPPRSMDRDGAQQAGQRPGDADMPRRLQRRAVAHAEHGQRQVDQRRRGRFGIVLQRRERLGRLVERGRARARRAAARTAPAGKAVIADRGAERQRHRMLAQVAARRVLDDLAPPLQPDLAHHRLADGLAHLRDLDIEGIEREDRVARLRRREQGAEIAVVVVAPHLVGAVSRGLCVEG